jgi:hypothetical protein
VTSRFPTVFVRGFSDTPHTISGMESETSPRRVQAALKAEKALKLRAQGLSLDEVAEEVGYAHRASAYKVIRDALQRVGREEAQTLFDLDMHRLDMLLAVFLPKAEAGDDAAARIVLRVVDRHIRMLGWGQQEVVRGILAPPPEEDTTEGPRRLQDVFGSLTPDAQLAIAQILHSQMQLTNAPDANERPAIVNGTVTPDTE